MKLPESAAVDQPVSIAGWPVRRLALLALGALLVGVVGVVAFIQLAVPQIAPLTSPSSGPCAPKPCLDLQGYTIWVSKVTDSEGVVRMQVTFRNASVSTHATPEDLTLVDSTKQAAAEIQDPPGCTHWGRTEFNNGARFGPITVCFRPASTASPLTLRWTPDMGFFCCDADLRIR